MNQLADFIVWMQIEEPNMPLDRNEREGYFYHDIAEKMWKAWKVSHMHWTPLAGRISPEKKRSFREDDFPDTLVDRLKGIDTSAMGAQKPSKMELEAAREIERLRAERDALITEMEWRSIEPKPFVQWWRLVRSYPESEIFACKTCFQSVVIRDDGDPLPEDCPYCRQQNPETK